MTKARDLASGNPAPSTVSTTELGYVDGVTSAIQTQMDSKLATATASSTYQTKATTGLVFLSTTSFTTQSAVTINPFTATYDDYKIVLKITAATAATDLLCQLSSGATPLTTASYDAAYMVRQFGAVAFTSSANTAATSWILSGVANTSTSADYGTYDFSNPFASKYKSFIGNATRQDGYIWTNGGRNQTTTSYDGIKLFVASGTITGTVSVYGYSK